MLSNKEKGWTYVGFPMRPSLVEALDRCAAASGAASRGAFMREAILDLLEQRGFVKADENAPRVRVPVEQAS